MARRSGSKDTGARGAGTRGASSKGAGAAFAARGEDLILGVPSRIMAPRLILILSVASLVVFGLVMIYSASSVTALADMDDPAYYLVRQAGFALVGIAAAVVAAFVDYHILVNQLLPVLWVATVALLLVVVVFGAGSETYGASRWLAIGPFTLQPSEFAKITLVLTGANLMNAYFGEHDLSLRKLLVLGAIGIGFPLLLIVAQPDKGSTLVILAALFVMAVFAGLERRVIIVVVGIGVVLLFVLIFMDSYSISRLMAMLNPFEDLYGEGWQLAQGYYAFGSGGLFGVGLGMSREKYYYLPFAHNDFIFAVIGEELGLLGAMALVLLFAVIAWAGYRVARYAPDLPGRLIAAGCTSILWIQMLINVCGVIGLIPSSGKPIPFVSYGGSSIIASLILVGLVVSVSRKSTLAESVYEQNRRKMRLTSEDDWRDYDESTAGTPTRRSERGSRSATSLTLVNGGAQRRSTRTRASRGRATGYERIDLGPSAAERLRGRGKRDR